jgi:hypothetical protein
VLPLIGYSRFSWYICFFSLNRTQGVSRWISG